MSLRLLAAATALVLAGGGVAVASSAGPGSPARPSADHAPHATTRELGGLPRIRGTVGPGFTIDVSRERVPAGRYKLVVRDQASDHNWHIEGRRVDKRTTIGGTGRWVWKVRLRPGTYTILCDPHPTSMRTSLRVVR